MVRKIALEEHFGTSDPDLVEQSREHFTERTWPPHRRRLLDIQDERLRLMDEAGIELVVLSLLAPGIQALPDRAQAVDWARRTNDVAAEHVRLRPDRFAAFAALALQDPEEAIVELRRAVTELGFKGALVNGFSEVDGDRTAYLDEPRYRPFWAAVEDLGVPVYLHPRDPLPRDSRMLEGHPWLYGSAWGFSVETGTHALRLMASGLFDEHPGVQVILGHLGELLPFNIWRTDHRLKVKPAGIPARRPLRDYLRENFHLTTSGNFATRELLFTIDEVGADRVLFSADYPFESMTEAAAWFDALDLDREVHEKIAEGNARKLLGL
ncbi:amidohydrolase family protein [Amycolatopsis rhabdoformis]|uniref:Amidohydrolase family protein n=1 Tax=Amycolatopsis rhabdoformis TaxID=1448059 RepID=A0ABZ1IJ20_9PSEU|nr:amidohydrolase family protein [Amycolatopsis rhabdoformis]WSE34440.1 amidohydrolase family protein [Amycolatopsis rhabdoformis]